MNPIIVSILLLVCSNVFMTFAWYAHLKELNGKPWLIAAMLSWLGGFTGVFVAGACQPDWLSGAKFRSAKNYAGSHYAERICTFCFFLHEGALKAGLCMGCAMYFGRCIFYVPGKNFPLAGFCWQDNGMAAGLASPDKFCPYNPQQKNVTIQPILQGA